MERIPQLSARRFALHDELFCAALKEADRAVDLSEETAAKWAALCGEIGDFLGCEHLMSGNLEKLLVTLASKLPTPPRSAATGNRRWLHVFSHVADIGGHSALAKRWISLDGEGEQHSLITTFQAAEDIPSAMTTAVLSKQGEIISLAPIESIFQRALRLRNIAWAVADVVVLHIHMWDIVPTIAFGIPGGPPVLLVNHADHTFWVGASVADSIINIRLSGEEVTRAWRGVNRTHYLPIPLVPPNQGNCTTGVDLRAELGIPQDAKVFLTIGSSFKYTAIADIDFLQAASRLIQDVPHAYLVAIGPLADHGDWKRAHGETNGRIIAVGPRQDVAPYFSIADVYLEGFPFGSLTALLEAALAGLPCIRAPIQCPPPFTSDGEALDHLPQPASVDDYVSQAISLIESPSTRAEQAKRLKTSVERVHLDSGWQIFLDDLKRNAPREHDVYLTNAPIAPDLWKRYWWPFMARRMDINPLLFFYVRAHQLGLTPNIGIRLTICALMARIRERPKGTPSPLSLALFKRFIDPIGKGLPYGSSKQKCRWWPMIALIRWYQRYFGWRLTNRRQERLPL